MDYWTNTLARNVDLVNSFRSRIEIDFRGKTVLDSGCGTGGLSQIVTEEGGCYIGSDFFAGTLEMAQAFLSDLRQPDKAHLIRASGTHLPFSDSSLDFVVAFDVIEHLVGGTGWQLSFLKEVRRVLKPDGLVLLTTPNRLFPFEGHTFMYGPQYLPVPLADRYIRWRNPSFLKEYNTYGEIHLLTPWKMKRLLRRSGLKVVHDLPWGMDFEDYPIHKRASLHMLKIFGLAWGTESGFWFSACRTENWQRARTLRKKEWYRSKPQSQS